MPTDHFGEKEKKVILSSDSRQTALKDARDHGLRSCSSKQDLHEWLVSELYCNYSEEDAQYILAHLDIDYKQQALKEAQFLATGRAMNFSRKSILELLATKGFAQEEISYAIEHLNVDFKQVALAQAESEARETHLSKEKIHVYLTAFKFTDEEVAYAMANLTFNDFKGNALYKMKWYLNEYLYSKKMLCEKLISRDLFTKEEAAYAFENLNVDFKEIALRFAIKTVNQPYTFVSKQSLYEHLAGRNGYGFTKEEATYAINHLDEAIAAMKKKKAEKLFLQECRKFAPNEAAYATENLGSAAEDFDTYSSEMREPSKEQNDADEKAGNDENSSTLVVQDKWEQQATDSEGDTDDETDNGEYNEKDYEEEEYDFPEPDFSDPGMIPDPHTCLSFIAKYEELAERARECGREDLAKQYEVAADHWHYLYEEAEDEEMEW